MKKLIIRVGIAAAFAMSFASLGHADERWSQYDKNHKEFIQLASLNNCGPMPPAVPSFTDPCGQYWNRRVAEFRDGTRKKMSEDEFVSAIYAMGAIAKSSQMTAQFKQQYGRCFGNGITPRPLRGPSYDQSYYLRDGKTPYSCDQALDQYRRGALQYWLKDNTLVGTASCNILKTTVAKKRVDGCSVDLDDPASKHFKLVFKKACVDHDICYNSPQHHNTEKAQCDHFFGSDMHQICGKHRLNNGPYAALCGYTASTWATVLKANEQTSVEAYAGGKQWAGQHCGD